MAIPVIGQGVQIGKLAYQIGKGTWKEGKWLKENWSRNPDQELMDWYKTTGMQTVFGDTIGKGGKGGKTPEHPPYMMKCECGKKKLGDIEPVKAPLPTFGIDRSKNLFAGKEDPYDFNPREIDGEIIHFEIKTFDAGSNWGSKVACFDRLLKDGYNSGWDITGTNDKGEPIRATEICSCYGVYFPPGCTGPEKGLLNGAVMLIRSEYIERDWRQASILIIYILSAFVFWQFLPGEIILLIWFVIPLSIIGAVLLFGFVNHTKFKKKVDEARKGGGISLTNAV